VSPLDWTWKGAGVKTLLDILKPDCVKVPLEAREKKAAIRELVDLLASADAVNEPDTIFQSVWEREKTKSTGIGLGLAIPHGKPASEDHIIMAIGKTAEPMDFGAIDKKPVRLIVLIATPPDKTSDHIQVLARISRLMTDEGLRAAVYNAESAEELYSLIKAKEDAMPASR
jgi:fructose-specific phosphotransferase system IIA component